MQLENNTNRLRQCGGNHDYVLRASYCSSWVRDRLSTRKNGRWCGDRSTARVESGFGKVGRVALRKKEDNAESDVRTPYRGLGHRLYTPHIATVFRFTEPSSSTHVSGSGSHLAYRVPNCWFGVILRMFDRRRLGLPNWEQGVGSAVLVVAVVPSYPIHWHNLRLCFARHEGGARRTRARTLSSSKIWSRGVIAEV
jgi:hypothetical protein